MFIYQLLRLTRWLPLNAVQLDPITSISRVISLDDKSVFAHYFSFASLSWKLSLWFFGGFRCAYSLPLTPKLSLIDSLTTEIYYRTGITGNTDRQTDRHTQILSLILNEWMKWLLVYRLSLGQWTNLKAVHSTNHRLSDGLPTWVEQYKETYSPNIGCRIEWKRLKVQCRHLLLMESGKKYYF